jgi:DNA-binding transcriptional ArsR family regulator
MQSFAAIADPTRRQIIEMLASQPMPAGAIAERFEISAPAVSQHLKVLREANLVHVQAESNRRIYQLNPEGISEIRTWLDGISRFWTDRLDSLEIQLEAQRQSRPEVGTRKTKRRTP